MTFGEAMEAVKHGKKIKRKGWNGKNQYVELATGISYKNELGEIVNVNHDAIGNQALAFVGTSGVQLGWLASQADMLADDWEVYELTEKVNDIHQDLLKQIAEINKNLISEVKGSDNLEREIEKIKRQRDAYGNVLAVIKKILA